MPADKHRGVGLQARDGTGQLPAVGADGVAGTEPDVYMVDEHGDEGMPRSWLAGTCAAACLLHRCCSVGWCPAVITMHCCCCNNASCAELPITCHQSLSQVVTQGQSDQMSTGTLLHARHPSLCKQVSVRHGAGRAHVWLTTRLSGRWWKGLSCACSPAACCAQACGRWRMCWMQRMRLRTPASLSRTRCRLRLRTARAF